jgi:hypothetical protein
MTPHGEVSAMELIEVLIYTVRIRPKFIWYMRLARKPLQYSISISRYQLRPANFSGNGGLFPKKCHLIKVGFKAVQTYVSAEPILYQTDTFHLALRLVHTNAFKRRHFQDLVRSCRFMILHRALHSPSEGSLVKLILSGMLFLHDGVF